MVTIEPRAGMIWRIPCSSSAFNLVAKCTRCCTILIKKKKCPVKVFCDLCAQELKFTDLCCSAVSFVLLTVKAGGYQNTLLQLVQQCLIPVP